MALITKLNNIANAIGQKTGEPASTYNIDNMPTAISNIQTAFPVVPDPDETKLVRFMDYDGTIVTQMTVDEAAELTSLPELPTHDGMTAVEWNYTLAEVTSTTSPLDVGAIYQNSANARQSLFEMYPTEGQSITLNIGQSMSNGVVIDWGDGSATETVSGEGNVSATHTYSSVATSNMPFKLTLTPNEGATLTLGHGTSSENLFNNGSSNFYAVRKAILGETAIGDYAFQRCYSLSSISIPNSVTSIGIYAFQSCYALSSISIHSSIASIDDYTFQGCSSLSSVSIPSSVTSIGVYAFSNCYSLSSISIPNSVASIGSQAFINCRCLFSVSISSSVTFINFQAFASCYALSSVSIPSSVTSIDSQAFSSCLLPSISIPNSVRTIGSSTFSNCLISSISIPNSVTTISNNAFSGCLSLSSVIYEDRAAMPSASGAYFSTSYGPKTIDCSSFTQVPTVASNFFNNMPAYTRILVPEALETEWKAAANWSTYANQIIGV